MPVAILTQMGRSNASTRHRALQHVDRLARRVGEVRICVPPDGPARRPGPLGRMRFFGGHAVRYARHRGDVAQTLDGCDAVLVQRGLYPMGPAWITGVLDGFGGRVVLDIDDALMSFSPSLAAASPATRWLYGPRQARRVLQRADAVTVSTSALAHALPDGRRADAILPTVPEPGRYAVARHGPRRPLRVAWVGNAGNLGCLDPLRDVVRRLRADGTAQLEVVCDRAWDGPAGFRRWREADEPTLFARYDVGIMPLPDTAYTRAKAGFKLLQYLAAGLAVVASPVGANVEIVRTSAGGRLASDAADWEAALRELAAQPALRAAMGARGRAWLEGYADLEHQADVLASLLTT
ncbi:MAG: hypothetical protein V7607_750 [Solirubrobacteraceae bacterium]